MVQFSTQRPTIGTAHAVKDCWEAPGPARRSRVQQCADMELPEAKVAYQVCLSHVTVGQNYKKSVG